MPKLSRVLIDRIARTRAPRGAKCTDAELRASEEKYRVLFESSLSGILITRPDGSILEANPEACRMLGRSEAEIRGAGRGAVVNLADPRLGPALEERSRTGKFQGELSFVRSDGSVFDVGVTSSTVTDAMGLPRSNIIFRDITSFKTAKGLLQESEQKRRRLFETITQGLMYYGRGGELISANPAASRILGVSSQQLAGTRCHNPAWGTVRADGSPLAEAEHPIKVTLSTGKSVEGFIIGLRRKGSEERLWLSVSSVPLFNPGENLPFQAYAAFEDITERLRAEKAISALARHNQALLAELQHRAKNSFNMITSMISLAIVPEASPETRAILESLDARVNCISELYSLLYSSGSSTEVQLDTYCVRIAKPLVDLSQNMGLTFDLESIKAPARIAAPIGLILTEVVTNAVKYAFPSGWSGGISISLKRVPQGALLEVLDDGAGLPALFDPDAMQGMGLKLIQGLSTQIEGHFTIEGAQKGTRCSLHFPLEEEPAPAGLCD